MSLFEQSDNPALRQTGQVSVWAWPLKVGGQQSPPCLVIVIWL